MRASAERPCGRIAFEAVVEPRSGWSGSARPGSGVCYYVWWRLHRDDTREPGRRSVWRGPDCVGGRAAVLPVRELRRDDRVRSQAPAATWDLAGHRRAATA